MTSLSPVLLLDRLERFDPSNPLRVRQAGPVTRQLRDIIRGVVFMDVAAREMDHELEFFHLQHSAPVLTADLLHSRLRKHPMPTVVQHLAEQRMLRDLWAEAWEKELR